MHKKTTNEMDFAEEISPMQDPKEDEADEMNFSTEFWLKDHERNSLINELSAHIGDAKLFFGIACQRVGQANKAKAKAMAEAFSGGLEILMEFVVPAIGAKLVAKLNSLTLLTKAPKAVQSFFTSTDSAKAFVKGIVKLGGLGVKANSTALFGDTEVDKYLDHLIDSYVASLTRIQIAVQNHLHTDKELLALRSMFDEETLGMNTFIKVVDDLVRRYEKEVSPIGESSAHGVSVMSETLITEQQQAYWIEQATGPRLAILSSMKIFTGAPRDEPRRLRFVTWVSHQMQPLAVEKMKALNGAPPQPVPSNEVDGVPTSAPDD